MEKYQLENPNNSRIYIDYRKEKDKVRFEPVGKSSNFKIAFHISLLLHIYRGLFLLDGLIFVGFLFLFKYIYFGDIVREITINSLEESLIFLAFINILIASILGTALILNNKRFIKYFPMLNTIGAKYYVAKFNKDNINGNIIEIPLFKNVFLEYKATESFSEHLERVEIVEHDFNRILIKKNKVKKYPQEYLWKAIFYFSEKPTSGELFVKFS